MIQLLINFYNNFFSDSTSLYFFSALIQTNAAIFSIHGVFTVFKMDNYNKKLEERKKILWEKREHFKKFNSKIAQYLNDFMTSNIEKEKEIINNYKKGQDIHGLTNEKINSLYKNNNDENDFIYLHEIIIYYKEKILKENKEFKKSILLLLIGIILNGFGILYANAIHNLGFFVELIILASILVFQILILLTISTNVYKSFDENPPWPFVYHK